MRAGVRREPSGAGHRFSTGWRDYLPERERKARRSSGREFRQHVLQRRHCLTRVVGGWQQGWGGHEAVRLYRRGAHYGHARRLNSIVRNFGRYLVHAKSQAVYRALPEGYKATPSKCLAGSYAPPETDLSHSLWLKNVTDLAVSASKWTPHLGEGMLSKA